MSLIENKAFQSKQMRKLYTKSREMDNTLHGNDAKSESGTHSGIYLTVELSVKECEKFGRTYSWERDRLENILLLTRIADPRRDLEYRCGSWSITEKMEFRYCPSCGRAMTETPLLISEAIKPDDPSKTMKKYLPKLLAVVVHRRS
jgi:hypothetical protein